MSKVKKSRANHFFALFFKPFLTSYASSKHTCTKIRSFEELEKKDFVFFRIVDLLRTRNFRKKNKVPEEISILYFGLSLTSMTLLSLQDVSFRNRIFRKLQSGSKFLFFSL